MNRDKFRGRDIYEGPITEIWYYEDTHLPVATTWRDKSCGHCGLSNTPEGHDGCIGTLPNVINACCGHGQNSEAYIQFEDRSDVRGREALDMQMKMKEEENE